MNRSDPIPELSLHDHERLIATPEQIAFADQVRELLGEIGVPGLDRPHSEAAI